MKLLHAQIEDFILDAKTYVGAAGVTAGASRSIPVDNDTGFAANDWFRIGEESSETAELVQAISVANDAIVATLAYAHAADEPVVKFRFNQQKFYGCDTRGGTYVEVPNSPVAIVVDDPAGTTLAYYGTTYLFFKATYYNSTTLVESSIDDANVGIADSTLYTTIEAARTASGFTNSANLSDARVMTKLGYVDGIINSKIGARYSLPLSTTCPLITSIATEMAAALLLMDQYSEEAGDADKAWGKRYDRAIKQLEEIRTGKMSLFDVTGAELSRSGTIKPRFYPNATSSADDSDDPTSPQTTRNTEY
jgi:phage gp36-like protein